MRAAYFIDHATFVARTILAAWRSYLPRCSFDIALRLSESELLEILERVTLSHTVCNLPVHKVAHG
jgi:hypothetical protein